MGAENRIIVDSPAWQGGYVYSEDEIDGVVAATNHLALTNPVGSPRLVVLAGIFVSSTTIGGISEAPPLRGFFVTNVSGGTLVASSAIGKVRSTMPNPSAEVRILSPTVTLGAPFFNSPATIASGSESPGFVHQIPTTIPAGSITLLPGEGIVLRTASGSIQQRWNLSVAWSEL